LGWIPIFSGESLALAPSNRTAAERPLMYGMLRRLGKQYSDHSIECLQLIGYCPATVVSEDEYGFQTSRTVHSIQRLL
jgi:hypothetical protein